MDHSLQPLLISSLMVLVIHLVQKSMKPQSGKWRKILKRVRYIFNDGLLINFLLGVDMHLGYDIGLSIRFFRHESMYDKLSLLLMGL
jgi:hypothetical protein